MPANGKQTPAVASIAAVGYLRRSSKHQDKSFEEQQREIEKLARRRCYRVVRWDQESKSGDDEDRPIFQALMGEMESADCPFQALLVYDQGRFSRLDKEAAAPYFLHLKRNDIRLESVLEGVIVNPEADDDLAASFVRDIVQYAKNKELKDLAARISRGKIALARQGIIGGPRNYGTIRRADGRLERGAEEEVKVLLWIFEAFAAGKSRTEISLTLNRRGVPSPTGKKWCMGTVSKILGNPVYCGDKRFGRTHSGRHYHLMGPDMVRVRRRDQGKVSEDPEGGIEPDTPAFVGEPLVPFDLWHRVQGLLTTAKQTTSRPDQRSLPLGGLIFCGHCGENMTSDRHQDERYAYYRCDGVQSRGQLPEHPDFRVAAKTIHDAVLGKLVSELTDHHIDVFCRKVAETYRARLGNRKQKEATVRRQLGKLESQYEKVRQNMLYGDDPAAVAEFSRELARIRDERKLVEVELKGLDSLDSAAKAGVDEVVAAARDTLLNLRERLTDPTGQRDAFRAIVERVTIYVEREKTGRRATIRVVKIDVQMRFQDSILQPGHLWQFPA